MVGNALEILKMCRLQKQLGCGVLKGYDKQVRVDPYLLFDCAQHSLV